MAGQNKRPTVLKRGKLKRTVRGRSVRTGRTVRRSHGREAGRKTRDLKSKRPTRKR